MLQKYNEDFERYLEDIKRQAFKIAIKFGPSKFKVDELVDEAWIRGRKSNRPNKSEFVQRAYFDMQDYIREQIGRGNEKTKKPQLITNIYAKFKSRRRFKVFDREVIDEGMKEVDNKDLLEVLLKYPTKKQLNIINSYYFEGKLLKEIGEELNMKECTVSGKLKDIRQDIRDKSKIKYY